MADLNQNQLRSSLGLITTNTVKNASINLARFSGKMPICATLEIKIVYLNRMNKLIWTIVIGSVFDTIKNRTR